jgi:ribonuclease G
MTNPLNRRKLYERLKQEMAKDNAKHTILPPSKFGLVQITRQRVRPETDVEVVERCPVCMGTGQIKSSILLSDEIENKLRYLIQEQNEKHVSLHVHPFIYAYLTKGIPSPRLKWVLKYKKWIPVHPDNSYHLTDYRFFNLIGDEIRI